jgi:hypothetical protein
MLGFIMEGKSVIAMSQGYVILGGVYIALTSYSLYIHFISIHDLPEDPWIQVSFEVRFGLAICTTARRCSMLLLIAQ